MYKMSEKKPKNLLLIYNKLKIYFTIMIIMCPIHTEKANIVQFLE